MPTRFKAHRLWGFVGLVTFGCTLASALPQISF